MLDPAARKVVAIVLAVIAIFLGGIALFTASTDGVNALRETAGGVILLGLALVL